MIRFYPLPMGCLPLSPPGRGGRGEGEPTADPLIETKPHTDLRRRDGDCIAIRPRVNNIASVLRRQGLGHPDGAD